MDAIYALYVPNAVFSQFLGPASMVLFPFLSSRPLTFFFLAFLFFSISSN